MSVDGRMKLPSLVRFSVKFQEQIKLERTCLGGNVGEGNVAEKEKEVRSVGIASSGNKLENQQKKVACNRRKYLLEEDPDWSPKQGGCVERAIDLARKRGGDSVRRNLFRSVSGRNVGKESIEEGNVVGVEAELRSRGGASCAKKEEVQNLPDEDPDESPERRNSLERMCSSAWKRQSHTVRGNLFYSLKDQYVEKECVGERNGVKTELCGKRKRLAEEDLDWSPGQGSDEKGEIISCSKRSREAKRRLEGFGLDYTKPILLALPASHSLKDIFEAVGWKVTTSEGECQPIYVSPSGTEYKSLSKALEEISCRAPKPVDKERTSRESVDYSWTKGFSSEIKMVPIVLALPADMQSPENERATSCIVDKKEASSEGESKGSKTGEMDRGSLDNRQQYTELNQGEMLLGVKSSLSIDGDTDAVGGKVNKGKVDGEDDVCNHAVMLSGDKPSQLTTDTEEVKDGLVMAKETRHGEVNDMATVTEIDKSHSEEEGMSNGRNSTYFCNIFEENSKKKSKCEMPKDSEIRGVRRSTRINGRRVAVDSELDLELFDGEFGFYSFGYEGMSKVKKSSGIEFSNKKNYKETSRRLEKTKFREVNDLLASCTVKNKTKSCNSVEHQPDEGNREEASSFPVETLDKEDDEKALSVPEEKLDKDDDGKAFSVRQETTEEENEVAVSPVREETLDEENDGKASSVPEEKLDKENVGKASSVPEKKLDKENVGKALSVCQEKLEENVGKASSVRQEKMEEENEVETLSIPEETLQMAKSLLMPVQEAIMDKEASEGAKSSTVNKQGVSCIKDVCSSNEAKEMGRTSSSEEKNDQGTKTDEQQSGTRTGVRRSTRTQRKHVPVDDIMDIETWAVDDYIKLSNLILKEVAKEDKQATLFSFDDDLDSEFPMIGNVLLNETSTKKSDAKKPKTKKQKETENIHGEDKNIEKDGKEVKNPNSKKCSPPGKKKRTKSQSTEKRCQSSMRKRKSVGSGVFLKRKKKKRKSGGCGLMVRTKKSDHQYSFSSKVNTLSWLIDSGTIVENEKVAYKIKNGKGKILKGSVTRRGIRCNCCKKVLSLLEFEAHAGSDLHQPWNNICVISGISLRECQIIAWEKEKKHRKIGFQTVDAGDADASDDICGICADGGQLICCDGCPSTFHQECLMLKSLPEGNWYCSFCVCAFCVLGECGQSKCIGTMELCSCNQCGCKYHIDCVERNDLDSMGPDPNSLPYCGVNCEKVASGLSEMVGISKSVGKSFSWTLLRCFSEQEDMGSDILRPHIIECNVKLSLALVVLHECFVPLVDPRTGIDMLAQAVYSCGSNFNRLNYEGFYTVILEKDEEIISVATLRLHGTRVAEMPFIGTRPIYRRKGMCRRLLNAIEEMLCSLQVEKLIIPAIPDMLETWTKSFSFKHLESSHKSEIRNLNMMIFAETTLLQKSIYKKEINSARDEELVQIDGSVDNQNCHHTPEYGMRNLKDTSIRLSEEIKTPNDDGNAESSPRSEVSNGSAFEVLPVQNQELQVTGTRSTPSELVDIVVDGVPVHPEIVSLPKCNALRWPQKADEAKDVSADSIHCTLFNTLN